MNQLITALLLLLLLAGCATTNKRHYEKPLVEMDVLESSSSGTFQIEEIPQHELQNQIPGHRPPIDSDEAGIWMAMDKAEEKYKTAGNRIDDNDLTTYLQEIACRLAPEYCGDIRIYILRVPYFNAFMAPNGTLVIWSGLLLRTTNEAQIASVIGHEIGHYIRRHSLQRLRDVVNASNALIIVQMAAAVAGYGAVGDLAYLAAMSSLQAYSRDQEREADGYGLAFMARAGYEPHEAATLWSEIIKEKEASDDKKFSLLLFDSHPPSKERLGAISDLADRITSSEKDFDINIDRFRVKLLPMRFQFLHDEMYLRDFARTEVLLNSLIEDGANLGELYHFKGDLYRLRGNDGDKDRAIAAYEMALGEAEFPPETLRALGLLYQSQGAKDKSRISFKRYLDLKSDSTDREMILHMLSKENR
jgi:predicted Zn-dependent protease